MRTDVAFAQEASGGMWVNYLPTKETEYKVGYDIYSGIALEVLDSSDPDWFKCKCETKGIGWVRRCDVRGLGHVSLEWAAPEVHLEDIVVDRQAPINYGFAPIMHQAEERVAGFFELPEEEQEAVLLEAKKASRACEALGL
eukprot:TRINITY_DN42418_c0_g1_i1.p1 TRINITY_DN42418_c0_g1~~TRINITY_DN42418_c0_g1_i1.p1  ORF type:complete len:141 (+),score=28.67 TRINITY_DN42418_c0_g1_i1:735-1157(+)